MHAGEAKNGRGQRAHGDKFYAPTGEAIMPAGKLNKNARRRGEQLQHPAGTRSQILPSHSAETTMPAGKLNKKCTPVR
ncbi:MAG: hypothetical protein ACLR23_23330 [Clostridia bacterium]